MAQVAFNSFNQVCISIMGAWGSLQEELDCKHEYCAKVQYQPYPKQISNKGDTVEFSVCQICSTTNWQCSGVWLILNFCTVLMLAVQLFLQWTSGTHAQCLCLDKPVKTCSPYFLSCCGLPSRVVVAWMERLRTREDFQISNSLLNW